MAAYDELFVGRNDTGGIIYGAFTGTMQEVTDAAISSSKEAVML